MAEKTSIAYRSDYGPPPMPPRDGDKQQARQRINVLVRTGRFPHPNTVPCKDCGHVWAKGERRHEYDHHLGYAAEHHYDVESVCTLCHCQRAWKRGEIDADRLKAGGQARKDSRKAHCAKGHAMSYGTDGMWRCWECRRAYWRKRGQLRHG